MPKSRQAATRNPTIPTPDIDSFQLELRAILGTEGLLVGSSVHERSAGYMRTDTLQANLLARPKTTSDVAAVLRLCNARRCPVVTHGGLTGLVRGCDAGPGALILSLERMNEIEEIDPLQRIAIVQAGVRLQTLQEAAEANNLAYPMDIGARGSATLGGTASTNAGGNRVIRYGMTRSLVLGLEAVLANGTVVSSLNRLIKNNAGYDLKHVFIGSEGTLGVITRLVMRLTEKPRSQDVALVAIDSFDAVTGFLKYTDQILGGSLSAFEVMWREFYELVTTPPARSLPPLPKTYAYYVLVESIGGDQERDSVRFAEALEGALNSGLIADAVIAGSSRERQSLWAIREDVPQLRRDGPTCSFDISLPINAMEAYVAEVRAELTCRWPHYQCRVFGHLGDGNLHVSVRVDDGLDARMGVEDIVYGLLRARSGSISAEHGIGLEKKSHLAFSRSPEEISMMRTLKRSLDPNNILNPGKVFDLDGEIELGRATRPRQEEDVDVA